MSERRSLTPEEIVEALLVQAVAAARRGPTAKPNDKDRRIVREAIEGPKAQARGRLTMAARLDTEGMHTYREARAANDAAWERRRTASDAYARAVERVTADLPERAAFDEAARAAGQAELALTAAWCALCPEEREAIRTERGR